jgi:4-hydroxy-2-oxoheptanedioate aldolase
MRHSRVLQRWQDGRPAFCTIVHLTDPMAAELSGSLGFDCIWIDMEHHGTGLETAGNMMRAIRTGKSDVMARPGKGEFMRMSRMLEIGAQGILYPRCDHAAEAREVVRWAKFAPLGERGFDSSNADNRYGQLRPAAYVREANANTWIAIQIESPEAAAHAEAIAEVEGVDQLFLGPADYSVITGIPGQFRDPSIIKAAEQIAAAARKAGKHFGTLCFDAEHIRQMIDIGADFIAWRSDVSLLRRGLHALRDEAAELGFTIEP